MTDTRPSRRTVLRAVGGTTLSVGVVASAGCLGERGGDSAGSDSETTAADSEPAPPTSATDTSPTTPREPPTPCEQYIGTATATATPDSDRDCTDTEIVSVTRQIEAETPTPTDSTSTPYGWVEYLVVSVRVDGTESQTLLGCVDASCPERRVSVSRTLAPRAETYEIRVGPFGHHCIGESAFWIAGCGGPTEE